ncbi:MAG: methyltransferase domain-containing protein [Thiotrichaceae bacterium]
MSLRSAHLNAWFATPLGERLLQAEILEVQQCLPQLFGYHLVQIGGVGQGQLLQSSRIIQRHILSYYLETVPTPYSLISGELDCLPFAADSIDVVVLPHVLEFEDHPHEILREVERVLIPEGVVIILGFNPISLWGIWRWFLANEQTAPWCGKFMTLLRVKDWLSLLGFEKIEQHTFFFAPPFRSQYLRSSLLESLGNQWFSNFGAVYMLIAKKRVTTLTPIKPKWSYANTVLVGGMPAARSQQNYK